MIMAKRYSLPLCWCDTWLTHPSTPISYSSLWGFVNTTLLSPLLLIDKSNKSHTTRGLSPENISIHSIIRHLNRQLMLSFSWEDNHLIILQVYMKTLKFISKLIGLRQRYIDTKVPLGRWECKAYLMGSVYNTNRRKRRNCHVPLSFVQIIYIFSFFPDKWPLVAM